MTLLFQINQQKQNLTWSFMNRKYWLLEMMYGVFYEILFLAKIHTWCLQWNQMLFIQPRNKAYNFSYLQEMDFQLLFSIDKTWTWSQYSNKYLLLWYLSIPSALSSIFFCSAFRTSPYTITTTYFRTSYHTFYHWLR